MLLTKPGNPPTSEEDKHKRENSSRPSPNHQKAKPKLLQMGSKRKKKKLSINSKAEASSEVAEIEEDEREQKDQEEESQPSGQIIPYRRRGPFRRWKSIARRRPEEMPKSVYFPVKNGMDVRLAACLCGCALAEKTTEEGDEEVKNMRQGLWASVLAIGKNEYAGF
ncbi:hypothetical protein E3N88_22980 [Mikania micrantha]|uniref:Uncharacterized protein n=1 Tax=Mikania micrantha TaxID=192012 RepID=A0A5N6ND26_9ASTR|nr:hypothetical protein E3N88_22980 [Mikania micrantha]